MTTGGGARIVLATFGSFGDLHPYLAVALGLRSRGHDAVIATSRSYQEKVEALGLGFRAVRPDLPDPDDAPALMRRMMDARRGTGRIIREWVMPALRGTYDDLLAAAEGADLLVSHPLTYAVRLVAETRGIRWASSLLAPISLFSVHDPPVLPGAPFFWKPRLLGPTLARALFRLGERRYRGWSGPVRRLRAELGLPPAPDPLFAGQHAPGLVLALFSPLLAPKQPDWPTQTVVTGFPFFDRDDTSMPPALHAFLDDGPPPIVFTLGSAAVLDAGSFYEQSAAAAALLGRRAVLLVGRDGGNRPPALPAGVLAVDYAPFAALFPRAAAIVHQGGVGTTGQAMRAGRPMLVMPYAHDQPDNAERAARLGIARTIPRHRYTAARAAAELRSLLGDPVYAERAAEIGRRVAREDGVGAACDALEAVLGAPYRSIVAGAPRA